MRLLFSLATFTCCISLQAQTQRVEVVEYHPAPGQFVNILPEGDASASHEEMCRRCEEQMEDGNMVHLGAYGGYMTVKFDHPVQNKRGSDFRIVGNGLYNIDYPLGGTFEPGIVYVGVGDDVKTCKWYELAGSEYYTREVHDFSITYRKPTAESGEHQQLHSTYDNYIGWSCKWTDGNGTQRDSTGYHMKLDYHQQNYWPQWENKDELTFHGGRLPNNAKDESGKGSLWILYRYAEDAYGYADVSLATDPYSTFDLDWAVDDNGNAVSLDHCDFIRVMTGVFQHCGWIGETSTEVASFTDLHLTDGYDDNPVIITPRKPTGIRRTPTLLPGETARFNIQGKRLDKPEPGLNIIHMSDGSVKKIMVK